jgi:asparagine synthetase B (glutamine-hydrolysing)
MNNPLPPLANLYAFSSLDGHAVDEMVARLKDGGRFADVWQPQPQWVVATAPLPHGEPDDDAVRRAGFAFVEGRDHLLRPGTHDSLTHLAKLVATSPADLDALAGDFGFVRFDPDGSVQVVRSCGGLVPFYLWSGEDSVAVATLLTDHARYLPGTVRIDPLVHATWTSGWGRSPDNRTFLDDVRLLPRGHVAALTAGRAESWVQYWDPRPHSLPWPTPELAEEHVSRLRQILVDHLTENLHPDGGNLLGLSGGVDSSSLAALAVATVGRPISTVSLVPPKEPARAHELGYIEPLLDELGVDRRWFRPLSMPHRIEYIRAAADAVPVIRHPVLCLLPEIMKEIDVRVLFGGELGDGVCGSRLSTADWDATTSFASLLRSLPNQDGPGSWKYPARWLRSRLRDLLGRSAPPFPRTLPAFIREDLRREYAEWWAQEQRQYAHEREPLRMLARRMPSGQTWTEMNWEATSSVGVRRSYPFVNRAALELAYSCHPQELLGPGHQTKRLLHSALDRDVPHRNLYRADKGTWDAEKVDAMAWSQSLPEGLGAVVRSDWVPKPPAQVSPMDCMGLTQLVRSWSALDALRSQRATPGP